MTKGTWMYIFVGITGLVALGTIAMGVAISPPAGPQTYVITAEDRDYAWRAASGPNGERDVAALPLYQAVIGGNAAAVKSLLDNGSSPNLLLHPKQWSALMVAAAHQQKNIARLLIEHGADVNYSNEDARPTALSIALMYGVPRRDLSVFYALVDGGANINTPYPGGREDVAIHAATLGHPELVSELLARGYRRNLPDLLKTLEIVQVNDEKAPAKQKAIAEVKQLLSAQEEKK